MERDADSKMQSLPITIVILTKNEEGNIGECIRSVKAFADDIHVLDSESADSTCEIARNLGVGVYSNAFHGFGDQRNWAIDNIPHQHTWCFHLDADERFTLELAREIAAVLENRPKESGFYVANKLFFGDSWLRFSSGYPVYQVRFFHKDRLRFINHGHGQREVSSEPLGYLKEPYLHFAFSKGLEDWFKKHATYAANEAAQFSKSDSSVFQDVYAAFKASGVIRRRSLKRLAYRLPCRSWLRLFQLLVLNRGVLDGRAGLTYARMMATYEEMIALHQLDSTHKGR